MTIAVLCTIAVDKYIHMGVQVQILSWLNTFLDLMILKTTSTQQLCAIKSWLDLHKFIFEPPWNGENIV